MTARLSKRVLPKSKKTLDKPGKLWYTVSRKKKKGDKKMRDYFKRQTLRAGYGRFAVTKGQARARAKAALRQGR